MDLKCRISTPLEAGTSILDAHRLPPYLTPALEYTSKRLASKGLRVTLVVARKDYQLPKADAQSAMTTECRAVPNLPTPPRSPEFPNATGLAMRQPSSKLLSRSTSERNTKQSQWRKVCSLPRKGSIASILDGAIGRRWPLTQNTPPIMPKTPATPTTPATPASYASTTSSTIVTSMTDSLQPEGPCIRMLHATPLTPKIQDFVATTLARATRRFNLTNALTVVDPSSHHIPATVLHGSILQNEVLFSSEGLTLLSMDHLYTFKSALAHYTTGRTEPGSEFRLEDAVDDLRRYVLSTAGGRRRLLKSVLVQAYDWLGQVNDFALSDVTEMYCRAYGGTAGDCGVEDDIVKPAPKLTPTPPVSCDDQLSRKPNWPFAEEVKSQHPEEPSQSTAEVQVPAASEAPISINEAKVPAGDLQITQERRTSPASQELTKITDAEQQSIPPTQPSQLALQIQSQAPFLKTPSPRASHKASLPALRVQTSFTQPIRLQPRRKEIPLPVIQQQQPPQQQKQQQPPLLPLRKKKNKPVSLDTDMVPLSAVCKPKNTEDICIEIHADGDDEEEEPDFAVEDADLTDFEDADLTARPPPSATAGKTPVEPIWCGIDEILGENSRRTTRMGHVTMLSPLSHQRRRSSSLVLHQQDKIGPSTPNGYDDISPITRGEWGFLMVSDPFRTKTAAVSCV